jgi:hypothetical protein
MSASAEQLGICARFGSSVVPVDPTLKVGVALDTLALSPLNALRHPPTGDTSGWYVWGGDYSSADNFFQPLHAAHLANYVPALLPYLALAAGWRVLLAPHHEDAWYDPQLLDI